MSEPLATIVFTDLVSSTAIKRLLPGSDNDERNRIYCDTILIPHRQRVEATLEQYGGRKVETAGDAFFLLFNHPVDAVKWAMAIQISHMTDDPIYTPLGSLQVKIGMHTGSPLRHGDGYTGHEVDYAARVVALASGGQILLSQTTAMIVSDAKLTDLTLHLYGKHDLKGIGVVPIYEVRYIQQQVEPPDQAKPSPIPPSWLSPLPWVTGFSLGLLVGVWLWWSKQLPPSVAIASQACSPVAASRLKHENGVNAVTFSPDGKKVATASLDNTARVWETTSGKQDSCLPHEDGVVDVTFSSDGKYLATASLDKTVQLREMGSGGNIITLQHEDGVVDVTFSRDGKYLATASADGSARVWQTSNGRRVALLSHDAYVRAVVFSRDGKYLATASLDNTARVWETNGGKQVKLLKHRNRVLAVDFSQDGRYLATGSASGTAQVWDWRTSNDKAVANLPHKGNVVAVAFSLDEKYLTTASANGAAQVWDWATSSSKLVPEDDLVAVDFSRDGKHLATASANGTVEVWDTTNIDPVKKKQYKNGIVALAFSLDGKSLAIGSRDGTVQSWNWK